MLITIIDSFGNDADGNFRIHRAALGLQTLKQVEIRCSDLQLG